MPAVWPERRKRNVSEQKVTRPNRLHTDWHAQVIDHTSRHLSFVRCPLFLFEGDSVSVLYTRWWQRIVPQQQLHKAQTGSEIHCLERRQPERATRHTTEQTVAGPTLLQTDWHAQVPNRRRTDNESMPNRRRTDDELTTNRRRTDCEPNRRQIEGEPTTNRCQTGDVPTTNRRRAEAEPTTNRR